jgi:hypothetical protein
MGAALLPTELSRRGWPPRSRTARYLLIRQAPSTGWVAASGRWRCRAPRPYGRHGCSKPVPAPAGHLPWRRAENLNPSARAPVRFRNGARHLTGLLSTAEDGELESQGSRPHPLSRRGPPPDGFISHARRAGDSNATAGTAQSLAAMPGPWPVHSPCRTRDSNSEPPESESGASTSWARTACERLTGLEPATSALATPCSDLLSYNRMEPAQRIELRLTPYQGVVLPLPLGRH